MRSQELADAMRAREIFAQTRLLPGTWIVLRVDGRGFSKLTEETFTKPFDERFHTFMLEASTQLVEQLQGTLAYTQSDEISLVLPPDYDLFDRRLEKLISLASAIASAPFSCQLGQPIQFDARAWLGASPQDVADYILWRSEDAARCSLATLAYWTLVQDGQSKKQAHSTLHGKGRSFKNELLFEHDINFNDLPTWQRRGVILHWQDYIKEGYNPVTEETVEVQRRRLHTDEDIPMKQDLHQLVRQLLSQSRT